MSAVLPGFLTSFSLIVAIGAQNAYLLRLGLTRQHVGIAVALCAISDAALIMLGIGGVGAVVENFPEVLTVVTYGGAAYLLAYAARSAWSAYRPGVLLPTEAPPRSLSVVVAATLAFTFLNPHVYIDTVLLVGSIGNQYGPDRWLFALGAATASVVWFSLLGFGAHFAAPLMSRAYTWRILDSFIALVMLSLAIGLLSADLG